MRAYSLDLRQKIVDAYEVGDLSQRQWARTFGVALSLIETLLKQQREQCRTGSLDHGDRVSPRLFAPLRPRLLTH